MLKFTDQNDDDSITNTGKVNEFNKKSRAQSLTELQERLQNVRSKKKLDYKDKLIKQGLKNRLKKKTRKQERKMNKKLIQTAKVHDGTIKKENGTIEPSQAKTTKPIFNREGKMVFSKFDFSGIGQKYEFKKVENDPKKILNTLEKQREKLIELEQKGEKGRADEIREKLAWKAALAKSEGAKIKDDPFLLKKTIKKQEQQLKSSNNKWKARQDRVQKAKDAKQHKRTENLDKRKKEKKIKKMKKAVKKGKIIPGF